MNRLMREFLEQEEVTAAAHSKAVKKAANRKRNRRFVRWLDEKAERIEASGNPAAAHAFRKRWHKFGYLPDPDAGPPNA